MVDRRAQICGQKTGQHVSRLGLELDARGNGLGCGFRRFGRSGHNSLRIDGQDNFLAQNLLSSVLRVVVHQNNLVDTAFFIRRDGVIGDGIRLFKRRVGRKIFEIKHRLDLCDT